MGRIGYGLDALDSVLQSVPVWLSSFVASAAFRNAALAEFDALDADAGGSLPSMEVFPLISALCLEQPLTVHVYIILIQKLEWIFSNF